MAASPPRRCAVARRRAPATSRRLCGPPARPAPHSLPVPFSGRSWPLPVLSTDPRPRERGETSMRIACIGGGPAGLYFAISMKLRDPGHAIDLIERNRADDTFGWGVGFSGPTVENLLANDPVSGAAIRDEFTHWDDIEVHIHRETIRS